MFELVALTIAVSIVAHSMTDVPVSHAFDVEELAGLPDGDRGRTDADQPADKGRDRAPAGTPSQ